MIEDIARTAPISHTGREKVMLFYGVASLCAIPTAIVSWIYFVVRVENILTFAVGNGSYDTPCPVDSLAALCDLYFVLRKIFLNPNLVSSYSGGSFILKEHDPEWSFISN